MPGTGGPRLRRAPAAAPVNTEIRCYTEAWGTDTAAEMT
jgi:hypothetical protein